jgi:hypothetical protein
MAYSKFEAKCAVNDKSAYCQLNFNMVRHHERYARYVESLKPQLFCQECGGSGGEVEAVIDYGMGPWMECGWCEGTGLVTSHLRSFWLRCKREEKAHRLLKAL